jgi:hypothetical protein
MMRMRTKLSCRTLRTVVMMVLLPLKVTVLLLVVTESLLLVMLVLLPLKVTMLLLVMMVLLPLKVTVLLLVVTELLLLVRTVAPRIAAVL